MTTREGSKESPLEVCVDSVYVVSGFRCLIWHSKGWSAGHCTESYTTIMIGSQVEMYQLNWAAGLFSSYDIIYPPIGFKSGRELNGSGARTSSGRSDTRGLDGFHGHGGTPIAG